MIVTSLIIIAAITLLIVIFPDLLIPFLYMVGALILVLVASTVIILIGAIP